MNIEATKLEVLQLILNTKEEGILLRIKELYSRETDWESELSTEEQKEIERGLRQEKKGIVSPHGKVMENFTPWK